MQERISDFMRFTKMQAYGNDYVYIDAIHQQLSDLPALSRYLSDRHFAIGSDGIVLICPSDKGDFRMRMFNPDGSEGEMCGNALRSVGKYVYDHRLTEKTELVIETLGGMQHLELTVTDGLVSNIKANIGKPRLDASVIPVNTELAQFIEQPVPVLDRTFDITAVSWGNPHCAMFIDSVADFGVEKYGKVIEHMTELFVNKTNVTFAEVVTSDHIKIREWERGTGETIGCGTGCATAVVAGALTGRCGRHVTVEQIGGPLRIDWEEDTDELYMTGPSHTVFEADIKLPEDIACGAV
jgi:diaminopimelate epimerase